MMLLVLDVSVILCVSLQTIDGGAQQLVSQVIDDLWDAASLGDFKPVSIRKWTSIIFEDTRSQNGLQRISMEAGKAGISWYMIRVIHFIPEVMNVTYSRSIVSWPISELVESSTSSNSI